jgi:hypothetical protein
VAVAAGFTPAPPDASALTFCAALANLLPEELPLSGVELRLADAQGTWVVGMAPGLPRGQAGGGSGGAGALGASLADLQLEDRLASAAGASTSGGQAAPAGALRVGELRQMHAVIRPRCIGRLAVQHLVVRLGAHAAVAFQLSSFPAAAGSEWLASRPRPVPQQPRPAPGAGAAGAGLARLPRQPFPARLCVRAGQSWADVVHVGRLPRLRVVAPAFGLVGEFAALHVEVGGRAACRACWQLQAGQGAGLQPPQWRLVGRLCRVRSFTAASSPLHGHAGGGR